MQVAGRAGRRENPGTVIIQTYDPENPVIQAAASQNYLSFYRWEIESRKKFNYPPFTRLARLVITHKNAEKAKKTAEKIFSVLQHETQNFPNLQLSISVPFYSKLHNKHRYQIIIKSPKLQQILNSNKIKEILQKFPLGALDIDPISLL
jgi:primosomal protein N' (replication factor Y)